MAYGWSGLGKPAATASHAWPGRRHTERRWGALTALPQRRGKVFDYRQAETKAQDWASRLIASRRAWNRSRRNARRALHRAPTRLPTTLPTMRPAGARRCARHGPRRGPYHPALGACRWAADAGEVEGSGTGRLPHRLPACAPRRGATRHRDADATPRRPGGGVHPPTAS